MQAAYVTIKQLVEDFKNNEKFYLSDKYQESQARQDFIDKFFAALGWDVTHARQKNPYEQEVKIENKVSTQGSQRRADYAFFIAPNFRDVKFYAEAKKPARNLKDASFFHQTIRYGWNSGTPIAILTDFEEFHILDCRYKPNVDDALNRQLGYFHYSEYADEEKFKKIFYLFSREAVANGSLEKYATDLPKPRGKAKQRGLFKGGYQPVDEAFLEELDSYRETLAKAFKKENPDLGSEELTEAVQRTIDRLVFIRFLEDKQIEDPFIVTLSEAAGGTKSLSAKRKEDSSPQLKTSGLRMTTEVSSAWKKFSAHCRALEPKYNGLVFKKHRILDDSWFVPPDDKTFADICSELADPSSPYDFDKIPISILGSIYECFLGKVVHATAKQVRVEPKPEVRKAGGVYYTPQYIVRYIVKETVGKLLYGESEKKIPLLIGEDQGEVSKKGGDTVAATDGRGMQDAEVNDLGYRMTSATKTPDEVAKMSFADIACGSGSFLIEVYSVLLEYHERYYVAHPETAKKGDLSTRDGKQVLSLKKRQEILVNNIYGVDIDFQATEVTQLSLYLKLLEEATLNDAVQFSLLKEKLLPDLRNNIICGNSLIGTDIYDGDLFAPTQPSPSFPNVVVGNPELGKELDPRLKRAGMTKEADGGVEKLKPMNFEDAFPAVMKRGGFDAVVGNPPYGAEFKNAGLKYLQKRYRTYSLRGESYILFKERAIELLRVNGNLGYIIPDSYLNLGFTKSIRSYLLKHTLLREIILLPSNIFSSAVVDTTLLFCEKAKSENRDYNQSNVTIKIFSKRRNISEIDNPDKQLIVSTENWYKQDSFNIQLNKNDVQVISIIESNKQRIEHLADMFSGIKVYEVGKGIPKQTTKIRDEKPYTSERQINTKWAPFYDGKHIGRYELLWENNNWIKYGQWLAAPRDASNFVGEKILIRKIVGDTLISNYDNRDSYCNTLLFVLKLRQGVNLSYYSILGILNSFLIGWYFRKRFQVSAEDTFPQIMIRDILQFPIPDNNNTHHDQIGSLVKQMLKAKEELAAAKLDQDVQRLENRCTTLDRQIDEAVYELYGLTEEEIAIVEGKTS